MPYSMLWVTFHPPRMAVMASLEPVIDTCELAGAELSPSTEPGVENVNSSRRVISAWKNLTEPHILAFL